MSLSLQRNKNRMRPSKSESERRRRLKVQRARLIRLGVPPEAVEHLQSDEIRALLRRPKQILKRFPTAAAPAPSA